jgi:hypothetical protein
MFHEVFFNWRTDRSLTFPFAAKPSIADAAEKDAATV